MEIRLLIAVFPPQLTLIQRQVQRARIQPTCCPVMESYHWGPNRHGKSASIRPNGQHQKEGVGGTHI